MRVKGISYETPEQVGMGLSVRLESWFRQRKTAGSCNNVIYEYLCKQRLNATLIRRQIQFFQKNEQQAITSDFITPRKMWNSVVILDAPNNDTNLWSCRAKVVDDLHRLYKTQRYVRNINSIKNTDGAWNWLIVVSFQYLTRKRKRETQ